MAEIAAKNGVSISGVGGISTAEDAAEFILLGANTIQLCTAPMIHGYGMITDLVSGLEKFMNRHGFNSIDEFTGHSLPYLTTFNRLVELKQGLFNKSEVKKDEDWSAEHFVKQAQDITENY